MPRREPRSCHTSRSCRCSSRLFKEDRSADRDLDVLAPEPRRKPWAWLLRHVLHDARVRHYQGAGATSAIHDEPAKEPYDET